jgi:hypothetical protein
MDRLQIVAENLQAELREALKKLREAQTDVDRLKDLNARLEAQMSEIDKAWLRPKQPGDPLSIRVMIETILESHPTGLKTAEIVKELEKAGHHSRARDPVANVDSTMYRHRPSVFLRGKDGRWTLAKAAEKPDSHLQLVRKTDGGEA